MGYLYKHEVQISKGISINIPTIGQIMESDETEDAYYNTVNLLTCTPTDMMVQLDDIGIDFTEIDDYELFIIISQILCEIDTSLVLPNIDFKSLKKGINNQSGEIALIDPEKEIIIDRDVYGKISQTLREIHGYTRNHKKPANEEAKRFMLERARIKLKRALKKRKNKPSSCGTESLIVSLVNTEQFKYNFEQTKDLTIYQFNECVRQVIHKIEYTNKMYAVYTGSIDPSKMKKEDFIWISQK